MIAIWNVQCTDKFPPDDPNGVSIGKSAAIYEWGSLVVSGAPIAARFWHGKTGGTGTPLEMPLLLPGTYPIAARAGKDWVIGFDFKNAVPGQVATVTCVMYEPERAGLAPTAVVNPLAGNGTQVQLAGYDLSSSVSGPQPAFSSYPLDLWSLEAGIDLLDITTDPSNAAVLKDGIYTWHFHCRFALADVFGPAPHFPTAGDFKGSFARYELQLFGIPGPLFSDHELVLPLEVFEGDGTHVTYPQASSSIRLPMKKGEILDSPFCECDVSAADPLHRFCQGPDLQVILLWEPIQSPFPVI